MYVASALGSSSARSSGQAGHKDSPVFIFGCPRSGTSLLSAMLGSHPNLAIPYESHLYDIIFPVVTRYADLRRPRTRALLVAEILRTEHVQMWTPLPSLPETLGAIRRYDFHGIVDGLLRAWAASQGKLRWGEKTPQHTLCWRAIVAGFEPVQVIHLVRDGRDVALSYNRAFFGPKHVYPLARRWQQYLEAAEEAHAVLGDHAFLQVRYEDLLAAPDEQLKRICDFLGEDFTPAMLGYHQNNNVHADQRNAQNLHQPLMASNSGNWRTHMTGREVRIFEALAGASLERYGYVRALDRPSISLWESLSCNCLEHPPRRLSAMLRNSQARRLSREKLRLRLSLMRAMAHPN